MKVSLITTVYNEENTIDNFLKSVFAQTKPPDEVIIVDGGSTDATRSKITDFLSRVKDKGGLDFIILAKKGNRSVGRNEAISKASNEIVAISDAGNILDKHWLENITKPFQNKKIDVVAGYYKGLAKNIFQKCLIPYVLVMPDKAKGEFLPATRSMAIKKSVWKKAGRFDERLSHNEDYAFANKLKSIGVNMVFAKDAVVNWVPRGDLKSSFVMFFRFALGDIEAKIFRPKVILIFVRYFLLFYLLWFSFVYKSQILFSIIVLGMMLYLIWAVYKNYRYVKDSKAFVILPVIQITTDVSVMLGSVTGFLKIILRINYLKVIRSNLYLSIILLIYSIVILSGITWGLPNVNHPFTYYMDEWHFLVALKSFIKLGTPGVPGGAYSPIFYHLLNALFLIPFTVFGIIHPFSVKSSVTQLIEQRHIFEVLRLTTLIYGILSIIFIYKITKEFFSKNWLIGVLIFVLNPLFILWSGWYKYDIPELFWITFSIYLFLKFSMNPSFKNLLFAVIVSALAVSVKFSALPLFGVYIIAFLLFYKKPLKNLNKLFTGVLIYVAVFLIFGLPDLFFNSASYIELLKVNLLSVTKAGGFNNLNINMPGWQILFFLHYPSVFGYFTLGVFILSIIFSLAFILRNILRGKFVHVKTIVFILLSLAGFCASLATLGIGAANDRILVLLPFMAITVSFALNFVLQKEYLKSLIVVVFVIGFLLQAIQTASWLYFKYETPLQESSSIWIMRNIPKGTLIGIENIPIYQGLPDIALKEFYTQQKYPYGDYSYHYQVIGLDTKHFPDTVIVTSGELNTEYLKNSPKQQLVEKLNREGFEDIRNFKLDTRFFDIFSNKLNLLDWNLVPQPSEITIYVREGNFAIK